VIVVPEHPGKPGVERAAASDALVGRDRELARLHHAVRLLATAGRSEVLTLTGPRGAGLSSLLGVAVDAARAAGVLAAVARCTPAETDLPYGVVSQLAAQLRGAGHRLELRALGESGPATVPGLCAEFLALAWRRPLLLAIDDVEWADPGSRRWLSALAGRSRQAPLLLVQASTAVRPLRPDVLAVRPLSEGDVRGLIASLSGRPADAAFVTGAAAATQGSPAVLRIVLDRFARLSLSPVAENLPTLAECAAEVAGDRAAPVIDRLPVPALALLRAMALCGAALDIDLVASLATPRELLTQGSLALLVRLGLVEDGDPPSVRTAVAAAALAAMPAAERADLARRAAVLAHHAAVPDERLVELVVRAPASGATWAVHVLRRMARRRPAAAPALLARALRENVVAERPRLLVELALHEVAEDRARAAGRLEQVLLERGLGTTPALLVRAADLLLADGDTPVAVRAIVDASAHGDVPELSALGWLAANDSAADGVTDQVLPGPDSVVEDDPVLAGVGAWRLAMRGRRRTRSRRLAVAALRHTGADVPFGPRILACRVLRCTDDLSDAVLGLDVVLRDARAAGARAPAALALLERARCELLSGNPARAGEDVAAARAELPLCAWHPRQLAGLVALDAARHLADGDIDAAARVLDTEPATDAAAGVAWAHLQYVRGCLRLALADFGAALPYFLACGRVLTVRRWTSPAVSAWRSMAAVAHAACGAPEQAVPLAVDALDRARRWGAPTFRGETHLLAARAGGDPLPQLTAAVALLTGSPARRHHAVAVADLARARRTERSVARLSADDKRVATLAAAGRSNQEIARLLSVAKRTVESRLTGIYRTLGLTGRRELATLFPPPTIVG
jgi:DNA-binding CsgD family transcriptional regulator